MYTVGHNYRDCVLKTQMAVRSTSRTRGTCTWWTSILAQAKHEHPAAIVQGEHLDAASKIYGCRVVQLDPLAGPGGADIDDLAAEQSHKRKERNRSLGKSTLCEPNKLFKINEIMKNLCVEVDAIFHKTAGQLLRRGRGSGCPRLRRFRAPSRICR